MVEDEDEDSNFNEEQLMESNLDSLLDVFGSKKTTDSITALSKIRPESWEKLAANTQAIIGMAGSLDPGIIGQLGDTIMDYFNTKLDAIVAEWLAPYLPQIMDFLDGVVFPFLDGILLGFSEIFSGFAGIRYMLTTTAHRRMEEFKAWARRMYLKNTFFPEMDRLYEGQPYGFTTDADIIAEQADLRPGTLPGGSQGAPGTPAATPSDPYDKLEDL